MIEGLVELIELIYSGFKILYKKIKQKKNTDKSAESNQIAASGQSQTNQNASRITIVDLE
jgi:hypothetical protein